MSDLHDHDSAPNAPARPAILTVDDDPLETSTPGLFAPGDVRLDWMKRVVSAVGEGARRGVARRIVGERHGGSISVESVRVVRSCGSGSRAAPPSPPPAR